MDKQEEKEIIPFENQKFLADFLEQSNQKIAEAFTGFLATALDPSKAALVCGRIFQGARKGKLAVQIAREIKQWQEEGKIKEDYAETKYGYQSLMDLMVFIDTEAPDEDRFEAVKKVFKALNSKDLKEEDIVIYSLFKTTMKLSSSQLLLLKNCYELKDEKTPGYVSEWLNLMAKKIGHNITAFIEQDEEILVQLKLLSPRYNRDFNMVAQSHCRLTDLGLKLCDYLSAFN